ncbi:MAG TPA: hypothetical protein VNL39_07160 [Xanthobacteraceae bacterium]|nr:hypothetical protein [Xanthobacteraceae bacterium]
MSADIAYSFKASAFGSPWEFRLQRDGILWRMGQHSGLIRYDQIKRVRLSFRPVTMQNYRFQTEIWSEQMPRLQIASTTWQGIVEQKRQDDAYTAFIAELHRRLAAAGSKAMFSTGIAPVSYWVGLVLFVAVALGLAAMTARALRLGEWAAAVFVGGVFALVLWQIGAFFRRNRPGVYQPDRLPEGVLPQRPLSGAPPAPSR